MRQTSDKVRLARVAISDGRTRGQFIHEHTGHIQGKPIELCLEACQSWSDVYSEAMREIEDESALAHANQG